jgi:arylsulfatase A-like enzyme
MKPIASPVKDGQSFPRVVWIVFDMLDQHTAFVDRPAGVELPEFDRLRNESLTAVNAYPPSVATLFSLPSLITGKLVARVEIKNDSELMLEFANARDTVRWSTEPNVFSRARDAGFKTALVGWYHPYCRVIGKTLDECRWEPIVGESNPRLSELTLGSAMWVWIRDSLYSVPFVFRAMERSHERAKLANAIKRYESLMNESLLMVSRQDMNLVMLHLPVPHDPNIYDAAGKKFARERETSYSDNLELADKALGELRSTMEKAGIWDQVTILVSSDHWWRESPLVKGHHDHRIPFILKLAGQHATRSYDQAFNTVVTSDLILGVLRGDVATVTQLTDFLDRHRTVSESPTTANLP